MFGQVGPSEFDLRFSLFGIPVRVHPLFWVGALILGYPLLREEAGQGGRLIALLIMWVACVFVSVLVHELGHALTARYYGWPPEIVLHQLGGYATFHPYRGYTTERAVFTLLAGPGAGFIFYGIMRGLREFLVRAHIDPGELAWITILQLEFINFSWSMLNLLPVFPLDGGQITRHIFTAYQPRTGLQTSLLISIVCAGGVAIYMLTMREQFVALMFGLLCFESIQLYQQTRWR